MKKIKVKWNLCEHLNSVMSCHIGRNTWSRERRWGNEKKEEEEREQWELKIKNLQSRKRRILYGEKRKEKRYEKKTKENTKKTKKSKINTKSKICGETTETKSKKLPSSGNVSNKKWIAGWEGSHIRQWKKQNELLKENQIPKMKTIQAYELNNKGRRKKARVR